ncbi:MAG: signal peptidase I [Pyrinomonadaceae bacterium]
MLFKTISFSLISIWCVLCVGCLLTPVRNEGTAMKPTLGDGDRVFINRNFGELNRGDIVAFQFPKDKSKSFVKRIIGLPSETVEVRDGKVFVNGNPLDETYISSEFNRAKANMSPKVIPSEQYFVMGDNRDNSYDSRSWGTLPKDLIYGKYSLTYLRGK